MAIYVLIHGAFHGGCCWDKVARIIRESGHRVEAPDLPGHGKDRTPIQEVTLQLCVEKVCGILDAQSEPVILVGHSMGGIVISQVAEYRHTKIKTLVYLAAVLLPSGESLKQMMEEGRHSVNVSDDESSITFKHELAAEQFYDDCSTEDISRAKSLLGPESTVLLKTPIKISEENFGQVPRVYIETLFDKAVPPAAQKKMQTALPCQKVISVETSHSPFLSAPEMLAAILITFA